MKRTTRNVLLALTLLMILLEFIYGLPFLGGAIIVSLGWQPLLFNVFIYFVMTLALIIPSQNTIRPMASITLIGVVASFIAFIPFIGFILHWVLFVLMLFLLFILLNTPIYQANPHARVIYTEKTKKF